MAEDISYEKEDPDLRTLADEGSTILSELEMKLTQPGILDLIRLGSPFFLDDEDSSIVRKTIDEYKSSAGLMALRDTLSKHIDWTVRCDTVFSEKRCRTDNRAKDFNRLSKKSEKFADGKTSTDSLLLSVKKQVALIEALALHIPLRRMRRRATATRRDLKKPETPEGTNQEYVTRKGVQGIIVGAIVAVITFALTSDWFALSYSLLGSMFGVFGGSFLQFASYLNPGKTTKFSRLGGYLLNAGYVMTFLAITNFATPDLHTAYGVYADVGLLLLLLITEVAVRWSSLQILLKAADYVQSGILMAALIIMGYMVSDLLQQPFWVGFAIVGFVLKIWDIAKPKRQSRIRSNRSND
jgi:F0F1-type ATP synthase assembly protein I